MFPKKKHFASFIFQPYTLKIFDAILTVAYALHSLLEEDADSIATPKFDQVCYNETVDVWPCGELLLKHIAKVPIILTLVSEPFKSICLICQILLPVNVFIVIMGNWKKHRVTIPCKWSFEKPLFMKSLFLVLSQIGLAVSLVERG